VLDDLGVRVSTLAPPGTRCGGWPIIPAPTPRRGGGGLPLRSRRRGRPVAVESRALPLLSRLRAGPLVLPHPTGRTRGLHDPAGGAGRRDGRACVGRRHRRSEPGCGPGDPASAGTRLDELEETMLSDQALDALFATMLVLRRGQDHPRALSGKTSWSTPPGRSLAGSTSAPPRRARPRSAWTRISPAPCPRRSRGRARADGCCGAAGAPEGSGAPALTHLRRASPRPGGLDGVEGPQATARGPARSDGPGLRDRGSELAEAQAGQLGTIVMTIGTLVGGWALDPGPDQGRPTSFDTIKGAAWGLGVQRPPCSPSWPIRHRTVRDPAR